MVVEAGGLANGTPGTASANGTLSASDVDSSNAFAVQSNVATGYGHFTIDAAGAWSYTLNDGNADVQGLNIGDTLTDTITVATAEVATPHVSTPVPCRNHTAASSCNQRGTVVSAGGVDQCKA